ncbi:protein phosphatase 1 regulatory subunit 1B, partial [Oxyura jamaicensis]|uniref:protein phosphatase 1 regulatory subunit 1B n=1 Tax=Oxyura jamaicensis TaxID=8884 RepID=UPI0015A5B68C
MGGTEGTGADGGTGWDRERTGALRGARVCAGGELCGGTGQDGDGTGGKGWDAGDRNGTGTAQEGRAGTQGTGHGRGQRGSAQPEGTSPGHGSCAPRTRSCAGWGGCEGPGGSGAARRPCDGDTAPPWGTAPVPCPTLPSTPLGWGTWGSSAPGRRAGGEGTPGRPLTPAVPQIRRRRPTPAMLFQLSEHSSPEDESLPYQRASGEGCLLKPKRNNPCAYTPPSLKAMQRIVQSHLESGLAGGDSSDGEADDGDHELARACDPDSALEPGELG